MNDCVLNPITFPLYGSRLIEASAGTGKTWTIAALYLRLILGHGTEKTAFRGGNTPLVPQDILVLTFTRAATRELTERIRARLTQAARVFRGEIEAPQDDPFLCDLLAEYHAQGEAATQQAAWRLALAAEAMDEAAVHTIDAWCQRMLREHALDSGQPFDDEFGDDEAALRQEAVRDYWRQQVYALDAADFAALALLWPGIDKLEEALAPLKDAHLPQADGLAGQTLAALLAPLAQAGGQLQTCLHGADWRANAQQMRDWLDGGTWNGNKIRSALYNGWLAKLVAWLDAPKDKFPLSEAACRNLSPDGLRAAWKGAGECPTPPAGFEQFAALVAALAARDAAQQETASRVRLHAAVQVQARLEVLKRQRHTFGFFDALRRLNNALHDAERGARLRLRILAQTPVALIDEFQDTSPEQYAIFNTLYRTQDDDPDTALLLIGDPKQSIYAFRGADIYAYLDARRATAGRHYRLNTNYRSTAAMVEAVNRWFAQGEEAREAGAFRFRAGAGAENPLPFFPVDARGLRETLRTRTGDVPPCTLACWQGEALSKEDCRERFAEHCAAQIVAWLNDERCGFYDDETGAFRRLRPADIAILVHDIWEAKAMRRALRVRDLPSVYLSERESVFASAEAADLLYWLRAVAAPQEGAQVRAALATSLFARDLSELAQLADDDETFAQHSEALQELRTVWQRQGVLAMLRQTLHRFALPARWLAATDGNGERRLTNFLHLSELLQNAAAELDGEDALIHWLQAQCHAPQGESEAQTIRLESDAGLIRIVTIHKSKGLEYPVVCLPFSAHLPRAPKNRETPPLVDHDERGQRTVRLNPDEDEVQRIALDERREGLRRFYVALTRARHAVWLGFAPLMYNGKPANMDDTAPGYLLGGENWQAGMKQLADKTPGIRLLSVTETDAPASTRAHAQQADAPLRAAPEYHAEFERNWQIGSFSALARGLHDALPLHPPRRADDEQTTDERARTSVTAAADWHHLPRGPALGNLLHEQLEWLAQEGFARTREDLVRRLRRSACAEHAEALAHWLHAIVHETPLAPLGGATLGSLRQCLPEMEFWLPARAFSAEAIDALCQRHLFPNQPRPVLARRQLHGMLMGFADLVLEHEGRYWVLDYKSNHLGENGAAYTEAALAAAMLAHRYDVQAALYLLALHRLLRARLGEAYRPAEQLGGALYLFARGIDGTTRGLCVLPTDKNLLALLNEMEALA